MLKLQKTQTNPNAAGVTITNAVLITCTIIINESAQTLEWFAGVWDTVADCDAGNPPLWEEGGSIAYDDAAVVDTQLKTAILANTAGATSDWSGATEL